MIEHDGLKELFALKLGHARGMAYLELSSVAHYDYGGGVVPMGVAVRIVNPYRGVTLQTLLDSGLLDQVGSGVQVATIEQLRTLGAR